MLPEAKNGFGNQHKDEGSNSRRGVRVSQTPQPIQRVEAREGWSGLRCGG